MSRWPHWILDALSPTSRELDAVDPGPADDLVTIARMATSPLDDELAMMVRPLQLRRTPAPWSAPRWLVFTTAVALAAVALWVAWPAPPHTDLQLHQVVRLAGEPHTLGPDIDFVGVGEVLVEAAGPEGNAVRVVRGAVHFEVDPQGRQRDLRVFAGDTVVEVKGTIFDVYFIDGHAAVDVTRGRVAVSGPWTGVLNAGQSWTEDRPDRIVAFEVPIPQVEDAIRPDPTVERIADTDVPRAAVDQAPDVAAAYAHLLDEMENPDVFDRDLMGQIERFISAYPESPLVEDAQVLALEVEARISPVWQVVPAIDVFLSAHPNSPRRLSMLELRATLLRENQDCAGALPTYRILATDGKGQLRARAEAWRGLCAHQLGEEAEARIALATALTLGVKHPLEAEVRIALEAMQ